MNTPTPKSNSIIVRLLHDKLNTFNSVASKLAADLVDHTEKLERELAAVTEQRDEAREALSKLAFYLSVGMGDESTTAQMYHDRIIQGIAMLTDPIMDCWEQTKLKLAESEAYADKLAAGLPTGMLPKDVENLREANAILANNLHKAEQELAKLKKV